MDNDWIIVVNDSSDDLAVPEDEPWMTRAFISKMATQVSLPYRQPKSNKIVRTNGHLTVTFSSSDVLPYGKYPRLWEMWACTMIKTGNPCFDAETNTINLGSTFREFLRMIGINVGGRQLHTIKPQLEHLFSCTYSISNNDQGHSNGIAFTVGKEWHIDWLANEPQERGLFANWVRLSDEYADKLRDSPVPINLEVVSKLTSPIALDVYWWLSRRYAYLHKRQVVSWDQLYAQFGSAATMKKFRQNFRRAVADVQSVYPEAKITCGRRAVTIYPSATSVPTTAQTRRAERLAAKTPDRDGHWFTVAGADGGSQVYGSLDIYTLADARAHLSGEVPPDKCPVCGYDDRNRSHHGV